jgi:hypothetical protein
MKNPEELNRVEAGANETGTRREFLRACFRYPVLVGIGAIRGVLVLRGLHSNGVVPCIKSRVCGQCQSFTSCDKPQAAETRKMAGGIASK